MISDQDIGLIIEEQQEKTGVFGSLKNLLKRNKKEEAYIA